MKKKDKREELFERVRAAKCYASSVTNPNHQSKIELAAFLDIFHPEMNQETKLKLIRDAQK